jgi:hypothetical protein
MPASFRVRARGVLRRGMATRSVARRREEPSLLTGVRRRKPVGDDRRRATRGVAWVESIVALSCCLAQVGCPGGSGGASPPSATAAQPGAATPDEAFERAKQAASKGEWRTFYELLAPATRDRMLGGTVFAAAMLAGFSADPTRKTSVEDLAKRHGVRDAEQADPDDMERALIAAVAGVGDKPGCFADFMAWVTANTEKGAALVEMGALERLTVTGDTAQGFQVTTKEGGREVRPIGFQRVDGRWFVDLTKG